MTTIAVIPARYASSRFPGKPLAKNTGKFLIQHVYERVIACDRIDRVMVATDDERIMEAVNSFGGEAVMTRADHVSGTHRVAEAVSVLSMDDDDLVLNVQGDEPEIDPSAVKRLIESMPSGSSACRIGTLASRFDDSGPKTGAGSPLDPNCVKVVVDNAGRALYFSRSAIPFPRDTKGVIDDPSKWLLHLGVYAFRADTLRTIVGSDLTPGKLEQAESLEQLRWLEHGLPILVVTVPRASIGVDTPEDYAAFVKRVKT